MGAAIRETAPARARHEDREERLARARAVLGTAERSAARWGGRIDRTALRSLDATESSAPAQLRPVEADESTGTRLPRSEEHTSELQSRGHLVCRLLLEKKKHN